MTASAGADAVMFAGRPLRVLVASKFWYARGGLERVMFSEIEQLEAQGVETAHFSTRHPANATSRWSEYFAPYIELGSGGERGALDAARAAVRMFRNRPAAGLFGRELDAFEPDVVHVHGIHRQLSPSILFEAARRGIPVVQTLHDAHHVCPTDVLLRAGREICEPRWCRVYDYSAAVRCRCVRGSRTASLLSAAETSLQRVTRAYERTVTRFISPSRYLADVMAAGGWRIPIDIVPNGVDVPADARRLDEGWFLVATRLSPEKRVDIALEGARRAGVRIVVAGDGPCAAELREAFPDVEFLGHVDAARMADLLARCRATVHTSVVPENAPMAVLESMAHAVPVVASGVGGIPEMVGAESGGILVRRGDVDAVAEALGRLARDERMARDLGARGRARAVSEFTLLRHTDRLLEVYRCAMSERGK